MNEIVKKALSAYKSSGYRLNLEGREPKARKASEIIGEVLTFQDYTLFKGKNKAGETIDRGFIVYKEYTDRYYWAATSQIDFLQQMEESIGSESLRETFQNEDVMMCLDKVDRGNGNMGVYYRMNLLIPEPEEMDEE